MQSIVRPLTQVLGESLMAVVFLSLTSSTFYKLTIYSNSTSWPFTQIGVGVGVGIGIVHDMVDLPITFADRHIDCLLIAE